MTNISIDDMYSEMTATMKNNFEGTPEERFQQAKTLFISEVSEAIEANKEDLLEII